MQIIYEDNHLIAVNKPSGVLVQGDETGDVPLSELVKDYIKVRYGKPGAVFLGVIHRIDRPVSGVVVFARTSKALERMNKLFQDRKIKKTYWAITANRPEPLSGHLKHYILKDSTKNISKAFDQMSNRAKDAKEAHLDYELIGQIGIHHLIKVEPLTGRPHQIRVQLSKIDCPIRGDVKYGFPTPNDDGSICLHCRSLAFEHPTLKKEIEITADPPKSQPWSLFGDI
ncbi:MAG: RluA family pseudouridine synthase [Saprospiraceae bacterium]|nr:RluA family pseudouridine synthase [Saprospiraceae bacterium]